jgi:AbrB family looped-hinge helix DNA binding protein
MLKTAIFTTKGQVVIPAAVRRKFGIHAGTRAAITATSDGIFLRPITPEYIRGLRGSLKGKGVMKALMADRKKERKR